LRSKIKKLNQFQGPIPSFPSPFSANSIKQFVVVGSLQVSTIFPNSLIRSHTFPSSSFLILKLFVARGDSNRLIKGWVWTTAEPFRRERKWLLRSKGVPEGEPQVERELLGESREK